MRSIQRSSVTAHNYARWAGGAEYRDPMRRLDGEVPADFLARLGAGVGTIPAGAPTLADSRHAAVSDGIEVTEENRDVEGDEIEPAGGGAYWARTSDLRGVSTALYQLS